MLPILPELKIQLASHLTDSILAKGSDVIYVNISKTDSTKYH